MDQSKIGIIIQARTGSTRYPLKIVRPFYKESSILELLIQRLRNNPFKLPVYVATTQLPDDDQIEEICKQLTIPCFRGANEDVLKRFIDTAQTHDIEKIVRVCADNPFLNLNLLSELVEKALDNECDYASFQVFGDTPAIKTHFGFFTEFVTLKALEEVSRSTNEKLYHEHVTNYIYTHSDQFRILWIPAPELLNKYRDIRLTIDTANDFEIGQQLYEYIINTKKDFGLSPIIEALEKHPQWRDVMKSQIQKNEK